MSIMGATTQSADLQNALDRIPAPLPAWEVPAYAEEYARSLTTTAPKNKDGISPALQSAVDSFLAVAEGLRDDTVPTVYYQKDSDQWLSFARAYIAAYRTWNDVWAAKVEEDGSIWTVAKWGAAIEDTFNVLGSYVGRGVRGIADLSSGAVLSILKGLWPILAVVVLVIIAVIIIKPRVKVG